MIDDFSTPAQRHFKTALYLALMAFVLVGAGLQCNAMAVCRPQAGKWTLWTGTVCYGEKPAR